MEIQHRHFKICKPFGVLSQFVHRHTNRKNKKMLGDLYDFPEGTMAIGRLDEDSEGLLLLTTDGKMSEAVRSKKVEKEYYAQVDGLMTETALETMKAGVEIGFSGQKYNTHPCKAHIVEENPNFPDRGRKIRDDRHGPTSWVSVTLTEGKNRQVRKMTAAVGFPTLRLVRVRIGNIRLDGMLHGEVIEMEILDV